EKEIKGWRRSKKDALVQASNPTWADLSGTGSVKGPSLARDDSGGVIDTFCTDYFSTVAASALRPPSICPRDDDTVRSRPVSILTVAVMPARRSGSPACGDRRSFTGRRCTTLTQLPDAFCGGSTANSAPVAGL